MDKIVNNLFNYSFNVNYNLHELIIYFCLKYKNRNKVRCFFDIKFYFNKIKVSICHDKMFLYLWAHFDFYLILKNFNKIIKKPLIVLRFVTRSFKE